MKKRVEPKVLTAALSKAPVSPALRKQLCDKVAKMHEHGYFAIWQHEAELLLYVAGCNPKPPRNLVDAFKNVDFALAEMVGQPESWAEVEERIFRAFFGSAQIDRGYLYSRLGHLLKEASQPDLRRRRFEIEKQMLTSYGVTDDELLLRILRQGAFHPLSEPGRALAGTGEWLATFLPKGLAHLLELTASEPTARVRLGIFVRNTNPQEYKKRAPDFIPPTQESAVDFLKASLELGEGLTELEAMLTRFGTSPWFLLHASQALHRYPAHRPRAVELAYLALDRAFGGPQAFEEQILWITQIDRKSLPLLAERASSNLSEAFEIMGTLLEHDATCKKALPFAVAVFKDVLAASLEEAKAFADLLADQELGPYAKKLKAILESAPLDQPARARLEKLLKLA
jgi:hypothetical protein